MSLRPGRAAITHPAGCVQVQGMRALRGKAKPEGESAVALQPQPSSLITKPAPFLLPL